MSNFKIKYFTATWCAPCKETLPKVQAYAAARKVALELYDVGTDDGKAEANRNDVLPIPAIVIVKDGIRVAMFENSREVSLSIENGSSLDKILRGAIVPSKSEGLGLLVKGGLTAIGSFAVAEILSKYLKR